MKGTFGPDFSIIKGSKCMVFVDYKDEDHSRRGGSRYCYGKIVDVFQGIITVEITHSSHFDYKKNAQYWFKRFQVWPEKVELQLELF